jgi:hypothetical protein
MLDFGAKDRITFLQVRRRLDKLVSSRDHLLDPPKKVQLFPLHMPAQHVDVTQRVRNHRFSLDEMTRIYRRNIIAEFDAQLRDLSVVGCYALESGREVGSYRLEFGVDSILLWVMYSVGIDSHVVHNFVQQLKVRIITIVESIGLVLEQIKHQIHVRVILAKFDQNIGNIIIHNGSSPIESSR